MNHATPSQSFASLCLTLERPGGESSRRELADGEMLLIGSGASCGLILEGESVAAMHCTVSLVDGKAQARDWNTAAGTFVDDIRIAPAADLREGSEIRIGSCLLTVSLSVNPAPASAIETLERVDSLLAEEIERDGETDSEPEDFLDFDEMDDEADGDDVIEPYDDLDFDDETLELLKAEIELLQNEVAERDARLAELESLADLADPTAAADPSFADDSPEVEGLVERLEQLLNELERCDERMSTMADLLRTAEDANAAEVEERRQIEAWISEIERRLTEREQERLAEQDVQQQIIGDLKKQLKKAEQQLDRAAHEGDGETGGEGYLAQVRADYAALEEKLQQMQAERDDLAARLEAAKVADIEDRTKTAVDEALREERLSMAQERASFSKELATLARDKAELERLREQLEADHRKLDVNPENADHRIRAFRDHLKEIHDTEPQPAAPQGLSARIGKIWRRLEGRPLDTD